MQPEQFGFVLGSLSDKAHKYYPKIDQLCQHGPANIVAVLENIMMMLVENVL